MTGFAKGVLILPTSTVTDQFRTDLERELGDGVVSHEPERLDAFVADTYWIALHAQAEGEPLGRPELVARPSTEAGVAAAVRIASEHGVPVVPWGGGSGTQGGSVPIRGGLVIDLTGLDRIVEIDERSFTVTCEAGVNGNRLERELNARGLMLPHYPASSEWATVGGYVAARGSGVLSTRYGKIEDLLLSLRVVLASGELIETVPVPRHAVGPELTQLFVGSEGTLGVITQVTLQIVPLPSVRRFATVRFPSIAVGVDAIRRSLAVGVRPSVIRMYDDEATRLALSPVVGEELDGVCTVLCFEGEPGTAEAEETATLAAGARRGRDQARLRARRDLVEPPLRLLRSAPPAGAALDLGHDRRGRHLRQDRGTSTTRCGRRSRSPSATWTSSCGCTSRTGMRGGR